MPCHDAVITLCKLRRRKRARCAYAEYLLRRRRLRLFVLQKWGLVFRGCAARTSSRERSRTAPPARYTRPQKRCLLGLLACRGRRAAAVLVYKISTFRVSFRFCRGQFCQFAAKTLFALEADLRKKTARATSTKIERSQQLQGNL